jgi:integrase
MELLGRSQQGIPAPDRTWKLGEYLEHWMERIAPASLRPTTLQLYATMIRLYIEPSLGRHRLDRLTVAHVQTWINVRIKAGDSPRKVQVMRNVLSAALSRAVREELLTRNVARLAEIPIAHVRKVKPWSVAEAKAFLAAAREDPLYPAFVLMLFLGLRRGEALGLSWTDVHFDRGEIDVWEQSSGSTGSSYADRLRPRRDAGRCRCSPWCTRRSRSRPPGRRTSG